MNNAFLPMVNNNENKCSLPGSSSRTNTSNDGNSHLNNRPYNAPLTSNNEIKYFLPGPKRQSDKASAEITKQLQKRFEDVFTGIVCFDGTFSLQAKPDSKPFQAPQDM